MNLCFLLEPARFITSLDWTAEQMHGTRTAFRLNWWYKKEIEFHAVNIKFVQGKVNYLNINFKLLKTEVTQAFLNVLKMKLGRVWSDTVYAQTLNTPLLRLTEKSNPLFAEGREKGHLQKNYFGDTVLCVLGEVTIIRSCELAMKLKLIAGPFCWQTSIWLT